VDTAQSEKPAAGAPAAAAPALPERQQTALRSYLRHLSHDDADQTEAVLAQLAQELQKRGKSAVTDDPMVWFYYNWGYTTFPIVVLLWFACRFTDSQAAA